MKKIVVLLSFILVNLFANELQSGLYLSKGCNVSIQIFEQGEGYSYYASPLFKNGKRQRLKFDNEYMEFGNLYGTYYADGKRKIASFIRKVNGQIEWPLEL